MTADKNLRFLRLDSNVRHAHFERSSSKQEKSMDIEFSCSKCGQRLVVDEKHAGTSVDCPKCQAKLPVPYKFQCSVCSFKSYRDFSRCPKCRGVGPGPLGDKVRKKRKWMRRLSFTSIALVLAYFLLIFVGNQVVRAKKVRIEKKLTIAKELIAKGEDLKALEELEEIQATSHRVKFKEEEIKQVETSKYCNVCTELNRKGKVSCKRCKRTGRVMCAGWIKYKDGKEYRGCDGTGKFDYLGKEGNCPLCEGRGSVVCKKCNGKGKINCSKCNTP